MPNFLFSLRKHSAKAVSIGFYTVEEKFGLIEYVAVQMPD